jgi:hypothetical protein
MTITHWAGKCQIILVRLSTVGNGDNMIDLQQWTNDLLGCLAVGTAKLKIFSHSISDGLRDIRIAHADPLKEGVKLIWIRNIVISLFQQSNGLGSHQLSFSVERQQCLFFLFFI